MGKISLEVVVALKRAGLVLTFDQALIETQYFDRQNEPSTCTPVNAGRLALLVTSFHHQSEGVSATGVQAGDSIGCGASSQRDCGYIDREARVSRGHTEVLRGQSATSWSPTKRDRRWCSAGHSQISHWQRN